jgi:hypothetical protein
MIFFKKIGICESQLPQGKEQFFRLKKFVVLIHLFNDLNLWINGKNRGG